MREGLTVIYCKTTGKCRGNAEETADATLADYGLWCQHYKAVRYNSRSLHSNA